MKKINLSLVKFEVLGYKNTQKLLGYHIHIRSTDQFEQIGVREKKMTEMRSLYLWTAIAFGYAFA